MYRLRGFLILSILLHLLLIAWLLEVDFSGRERPSYAVYEVAIVAAAPRSARPGPAVSGRRPAGKPAVKKYIRHEGTPGRGLGAVGKPRTRPAETPALQPDTIEPQPVELDGLDSGGLTPTASEPGTGRTAPDGSDPAGGGAVAAWLAQVEAGVMHNWRLPPELALLDQSLKTTYTFEIARDGAILNRWLTVSSGNRPFDRSVDLALSRTRRLPRPPLVLMAGKDSEIFSISFAPPQANH